MSRQGGMRSILCSLIIGLVLSLAAAPYVIASMPALKLAPLKYVTQLQPGHPKDGALDISNPTDTRLRIVTEVQAFRQMNNQGDLQFYPDEALQAAVQLSSTDFIIGPREAIRVHFRINPNLLPSGGVYGVIFFRTVPETGDSKANQIMTSARVGTLLILTVGDKGSRQGSMAVRVPFLSFGSGIRGMVEYTNTNRARDAVAYSPALGVRTGFFGGDARLTGPLVFPGRTRSVPLERPGNYVGFVPVRVNDTNGHAPAKTVWTFAVTGVWRVVFGVALLALLAIGYVRYGKRSRRRGYNRHLNK